MTTSNHALAGTIIAVAVKQPEVALPLSFLSHFVLDSIPHYGHPGEGLKETLKHRRTLLIELFGLVGLLVLFLTGAWGVGFVFLCAFVACSPDLEWPLWYVLYERRGQPVPRNRWTIFHKRIQREYFWGIFVEIPLFIVGFAILAHILK